MLEAGRDARSHWPGGWRSSPVRRFAISETPRYVGRAWRRSRPIRTARWNGRPLSSGPLAREYGFTDVDGSRPDASRYLVEVQDAGKPADVTGCR